MDVCGMASCGIYHRITEYQKKVVDDHQVQVLQPKEPNVSKARVVNTGQKYSNHPYGPA